MDIQKSLPVTHTSNDVITSDAQLPKGRVISYVGDVLALPDAARKELAAWDITTGTTANESKKCWILATRNVYNSPAFAQLLKNAEREGYVVIKKAIAEQGFIGTLYEKRSFDESQKATKDDSIVVAFFEKMLQDAILQDVSDIHVETRATSAVIRMRKHGEMRIYQANMTTEDAINLGSVIYNVLAENKDVAFDPEDYQAAAINYKVSETEIKLRYQSLPVYPNGFDIVMRLLPIGKDEEFTSLRKLGYTQQQEDTLMNIVSRPVGSLTIAGTTGSGKSTTLKNLLMYINKIAEFKLKIYSIEDPPEYKIPRISQIPVVRRKGDDEIKGGSKFGKAITACMRADPDIIMVGEVRDAITGDLVKKAIQSGHQVLTTVHAASAIRILERYLDFGLSHSVMASPEFLTGLCYQKLLPISCPNCRISFKEAVANDLISGDYKKVQRRLKDVHIDTDKYDIFVRGPGCEKCGGMGVSGRTVCAEIIMLDFSILEYIAKGDMIGLMRYWRSLSDNDVASETMTGKTAMEHAVQKMLNGIVDPLAVEKEFKPLNELFADKGDGTIKPAHGSHGIDGSSVDALGDGWPEEE